MRRTADELGEGLRLLVAKPGLDGHSNGAEQIAVRARDAGFEVVYQGIRSTPEQIVAAAVAEDVHLVGISILSGSHMELVPAVLDGLREAGLGDLPVIVGGIIPDSDGRRLQELGVAASLGLPQLLVRQRPRVAILSTGDVVGVHPVEPRGGVEHGIEVRRVVLEDTALAQAGLVQLKHAGRKRAGGALSTSMGCRLRHADVNGS